MWRRPVSVWAAALLIACQVLVGEVPAGQATLLAECPATPLGVTAYRDTHGEERLAVAYNADDRLAVATLPIAGGSFEPLARGDRAVEAAPLLLFCRGDRLISIGVRSHIGSGVMNGASSSAAADLTPAPSVPAESGPPLDVAVLDGRVFVATPSRIYRQRLTDRGLTAPREVFAAGRLGGIAASPRGYLAVLHRGEAQADWRLGFYNPRTPQLAGPSLPTQGVGEPLAMVYAGASADDLFVLAADSLSRLETELDPTGRQQAMAKVVTPLNEAVAMTPLGGGELVVAQAEGGLYRVAASPDIRRQANR